MLEHMEDTFPQHQEHMVYVKQRADTFKKQILEYASKELTEENSKIAVVSHSMFMKVLTSKDVYWADHFDINDP